MSDEATIYNMGFLRSFDNSVAKYIKANKISFISYGSEFCPLPHLEPLLKHHWNWPHFMSLLSYGSDWPLSTITEQERVQKNQ